MTAGDGERQLEFIVRGLARIVERSGSSQSEARKGIQALAKMMDFFLRDFPEDLKTLLWDPFRSRLGDPKQYEDGTQTLDLEKVVTVATDTKNLAQALRDEASTLFGDH